VPDDAAGLRAANARLRELLAERDAEIARLHALVAEIAELREQVTQLRVQVADLAERVRRNSKNSSRPTTVDGLGEPAPKSLRKKPGRPPGRKPGRPEGQAGKTMELTVHPDHVVRHAPGWCSGCGAGLDDAEETGMERRQVTEIPPVKAEVTEHQLVELLCTCYGTVTKAQAPPGSRPGSSTGRGRRRWARTCGTGSSCRRDRACAAQGEMFRLRPCSGRAGGDGEQDRRPCQPRRQCDRQGPHPGAGRPLRRDRVPRGGTLAWVHSASSGKFVLVTVHAKRGTEGMDAARVLPSFAGIACHDAWKPYAGYDGVAGRRSKLQRNATPSRPGCATSATTISGSPVTCGSHSTTTKPNRSSG
jgi:transposase